MIYAIFAMFNILALFLTIRLWMSGEDLKLEAKSFPIFLCLTVIEGLMLVTTLVPPSSGLFGGILFAVWMYRHLLSARAIIQEKVIENNDLVFSVFINLMFFVLVSFCYLG